VDGAVKTNAWKSKALSFNENLLKGRTVKITENPGLHLVWYYKELYVKPLPKCLFSYGFWEKHLTEQEQSSNKSSKRRAALGFVRSYAYLIRHESDFRYRHGWDTIQSCEQLSFEGLPMAQGINRVTNETNEALPTHLSQTTHQKGATPSPQSQSSRQP
jgi:hypothetical protein